MQIALFLNLEQNTRSTHYPSGSSIMHLKYRGVSYQPSTETVNFESVLQSEKIYRGVHFQTQQGHARAPKLGVKLTYRGVRYTV